MKNLLLSPLLLLICIGWMAPAHAEKADRNKPMIFEANNMRYDDVQQVTVITGNVVMTKGTIVMRADRIEVREDPDGYQFGILIAGPDKPAFFRQKREAMDEFIEVESQRIEYDGRADVVKFMGKALFRRLRGASLADEITGELIIYENLTDKFSVDGAPSGGGAPAPGQRIRAMLTPKPELAASAPQTGAAVPAPALRATTTLGAPAK